MSERKKQDRTAYNDPDYKAFQRALQTNSVTCHWCLTARAVTPDHEPSLALFESYAAWRQAGGVLVPACDHCNKRRGGQVRGEIARAKRGKIKRSAIKYPASSW